MKRADQIVQKLEEAAKPSRENFSFYLSTRLIRRVRDELPGVNLSRLVEELLGEFLRDLDSKKPVKESN